MYHPSTISQSDFYQRAVEYINRIRTFDIISPYTHNGIRSFTLESDLPEISSIRIIVEINRIFPGIQEGEQIIPRMIRTILDIRRLNLCLRIQTETFLACLHQLLNSLQLPFILILHAFLITGTSEK